MTADELITQRFLEQEKEIKKLKEEINQKIEEKNHIVDILTMCVKFGDTKVIDNPSDMSKSFGFIVKFDWKTLQDSPELNDFERQYMALLRRVLNNTNKDEFVEE